REMLGGFDITTLDHMFMRIGITHPWGYLQCRIHAARSDGQSFASQKPPSSPPCDNRVALVRERA
ncbi:hypothetical protein, partial [Paraglaciecola chathamensis]|uniref:hypothetical protein n=1 Tax=Paraglaciecola chathamensis TaxID=368405 RepID=UPI00362FD8BA